MHDFPGTPAVALVSARAARALDEDLPPLLVAFNAAGARCEIADWDDPHIEWARFDVALLRSTWDYSERLAEFLAWVERAAARTQLLNPAPVVRWNADKHYLRELAQQGLPVVASSFAEPAAEPAAVLAQFLARETCAEFVVKPAVGAGSRDTRRHARAATPEALAHIGALLDAQRSVLLQPYLPAVDADGETALIFIAGRFSHAIRKGALLPAGAPATRALFAPEKITPRAPQADEMQVAQRVLAALPCGVLPYARVDLIRDQAHAPCLLELELIEPSLFFAHAPDSAPRLAAAVLARVQGLKAP
jgi:glutathione synthase/RimK-type ligase-like ATP-grasp enzyme